jgi:small subunit ribosomal protein S9
MVKKTGTRKEEKRGKAHPKKPKPSKKEEKPAQKKGIVFTTGKRKRAIARATFRPGKGVIKINSVPLELFRPEIIRMRINEPLTLVGDAWKSYDIKINVAGGGVIGQADAARQCIARGLSELLGADVKKRFTEYDRNLLVYDPRRTEPHKPPRSSQGPRRYKQRSKR